jgi:hypothetical protein
MKVRWQIWAMAFLACILALAAVDAQGQQSTTLYTNTSGFDNAEPLNELIRLTRGPIMVEGGVYYHQTPIVIKDDCTAIYGAGLARWRRKGSHKDPAVVFVYNGPPDQPAWKISGDGVRLVGINIWGGFYDDGRKGVGVEWKDWGRRHVEHCGFYGFDIDWKLADSNHNDCLTGSNIAFGGRVNIESHENQAASMDLRGVWLDGDGDTFINVAGGQNGGGGNWTFSTVFMGGKRTLLTGKGTVNTCTYSFPNLKIDNNAKGWKLARWTGLLNLEVNGHVGRLAEPAPDWFTAPSRPRGVLWRSGKNIFEVLP